MPHGQPACRRDLTKTGTTVSTNLSSLPISIWRRLRSEYSDAASVFRHKQTSSH
jgi:hypothetical protein